MRLGDTFVEAFSQGAQALTERGMQYGYGSGGFAAAAMDDDYTSACTGENCGDEDGSRSVMLVMATTGGILWGLALITGCCAILDMCGCIDFDNLRMPRFRSESGNEVQLSNINPVEEP